ncbi:hypothetical protein AURDEDRAFT_131460 [Auricularia subglabra TFB-10046 SS5]|uniref:Uncharacterized protein n=1 Tax=Auricularia subglabra (strain TFB-10046 / SS5) TaxID=717982 RepID=J0CU68_AURST|nr:hypothetical protein AURDEDRAFT_131460 [Auricularia subglabra TFB-10046 SS5]
MHPTTWLYLVFRNVAVRPSVVNGDLSTIRSTDQTEKDPWFEGRVSATLLYSVELVSVPPFLLIPWDRSPARIALSPGLKRTALLPGNLVPSQDAPASGASLTDREAAALEETVTPALALSDAARGLTIHIPCGTPSARSSLAMTETPVDLEMSVTAGVPWVEIVVILRAHDSSRAIYAGDYGDTEKSGSVPLVHAKHKPASRHSNVCLSLFTGAPPDALFSDEAQSRDGKGDVSRMYEFDMRLQRFCVHVDLPVLAVAADSAAAEVKAMKLTLRR